MLVGGKTLNDSHFRNEKIKMAVFAHLPCSTESVCVIFSVLNCRQSVCTKDKGGIDLVTVKKGVYKF